MKRILKIGVIVIFTLFLVEVISYFLICSYTITPQFTFARSNLFATDKPYTHFDIHSGYKYIPGKIKFIQIVDKTLIVDHVININNKGYCSINDFEHKKQPGEFRYIVFGDSYSAGEIVDTTWPDILKINLSEHLPSENLMFYNFSLEASGISNWHSQFFNEVVPNYEFDAILFAIFGTESYHSYNLCRDFIVKHSDDEFNSISFFEKLPQKPENFSEEIEPFLIQSSNIYDSTTFDIHRKKALEQKIFTPTFKFQPLKPYFSKNLYNLFSLLSKYTLIKKNYPNKQIDTLIKKDVDSSFIREFIGETNYQKLFEIIDFAKQHNKQIIIATVPSIEIIQRFPDSYKDNIFNHQLRSLSEQYQLNFIDGYGMYDQIEMDSLKNYHLQGDNHWNRNGINLFSKYLQEYLLKDRQMVLN